MLTSSNIWAGNGGPGGQDGQRFKCSKKNHSFAHKTEFEMRCCENRSKASEADVYFCVFTEILSAEALHKSSG